MKLAQKHRDQLSESLQKAFEAMQENKVLLDAYLYKSRTRCGGSSCKCMTSDYRHESNCLSFSDAGSSRTRTVRERHLKELRSLTAEYKDLRKARKQLVSQWKKVLGDFDREVNSRLKRGRKRLDVLLAEKELDND